MIYLFCGSDDSKVRQKVFAFVEAARAKQPELAYAKWGSEEITPAILEYACEAGGLFTKRALYVLEVAGESAELVEADLKKLAESDNAIVLMAPDIKAPFEKKIRAKAVKVYEYSASATVPARGFNFGVANALASKSRERLWLEVVRALRMGDAPEAIHGLLHWKARDLLAKESRGWSREEARALSLKLLEVLQKSRRTGADLSETLEKFALSV